MDEKQKLREIIFHAVRSSNHPQLITAVNNYQQQLIEQNRMRSFDGGATIIDVDEEVKRLLSAEYEGFGTKKAELLLNMAVNENSEKIVRSNQ